MFAQISHLISLALGIRETWQLLTPLANGRYYMLYEIVNRFPEDMIKDKDSPLISLYQPTHKASPDNKQDLIIFKNLLRDIEKSLEQLPGFDSVDKIMKPFWGLKEDKEFWNHTSEGIAVFATVNKCIVYKLDNPVKELAIVGKTFHIKPLLKANQTTENYLLLGLSKENFSLLKGNKNGFKPIEIDKELPRTLQEVLGFEKTEINLTHGSYSGAGNPAMYHGYGDVNQEIEKDTEKYFRYVDGFVSEHYSKPMKMPVILITLTEHHALFKQLSNNPYLLEAGINKSIDAMDMKEIQSEAWKIIETIKSKSMPDITETFTNAEADALGSSDLESVAKAAIESRVDTLYIEEDKSIPGKIDKETGKVIFSNTQSLEHGDLLDDLADIVLSGGGKVTVLSKDEMPSKTGVAAIYRYKI